MSTIKLLGLQPDDIQVLNIVRDDDVIVISLTLAKKNHVCPVCGCTCHTLGINTSSKDSSLCFYFSLSSF